MKSILFVLLLTCITCQGEVIYVDWDAQGTGDGSSWDDAFGHLQDALGQAVFGDEIRVAEGIYKPDEDIASPDGTGNRSASFQLKNGVNLKGGYWGFGNTDPSLRSISDYETILSGDLNENDGLAWTNRNDNASSVVTGHNTNNTAAIDGFTIKGGYETNWHGGGLWTQSGAPTVLNCMFTDNLSKWGGGMSNKYGNPIVTNCYFIGNKANHHGGGVDNVWNSSPVITNCIFLENNAAGHGGAISNDQSCSPSLNNCTIIGNSTGGPGGGIRNIANSNPIVINTILWDNIDQAGKDFSSQFSGGYTSNISYSCVQGWDDYFAGTGNFSTDPLLELDSYHISPNSPCINAGDPNYAFDLNATDIDGEYRVMNGRIDVGADELGFSGVTSIEYMIRSVLQNKMNAWESLLAALSEEKQVMSAFEEYLLEGDFTDLEPTEAIKARNRVKAALMHERIASHMLAKSMKELEDALALLVEDSVLTNKAVPVFHNHKKFNYELVMADVNGDQRVDLIDLQLLCGYWLKKYEVQE